MERTLISCWILLCIPLAPAYSQYYSTTVPSVPVSKKVTDIHFFFHGTIGGPNATAVPVARANITGNGNSSPGPSYSIVVDSAPLTVGLEPTLEIIGNAQGLEVFPGRDTTTVVVYLDFGFTTGDLNGSSIGVFSRNPATETERELAVVAGRGKFRLAKGFALLKTRLINNNSFVVEYNVTVIHY
ncbi:dirigent protein 23-like [Hibiscus syriacus]|uniref:Dirigent protein n=1 Tax=Hibiscus syriacus TaxID=106335 RepID=A0A6A2ZLK4_HIBSY|nr:dirigent protein 4-like [Hibiscus syriacus]KAE8692633.1 dirigent protein 23-like [Hibiscus syriacus]